MPRRCTCCSHEDRAEIDFAIIARQPYRRIAARFGMSEGAVRRHTADHLPLLIAQAYQQDQSESESLVRRINQLTLETRTILRDAKDTGELDTALRAIARLEKQLELEAKIERIITEGATVNLTVNPQWLEIRAVVVGALGPHPEAREAVVRALEGAA